MIQRKKSRLNQFIRNRKSFVIVTILCMGIGFAFLSSNLTITGNTSVSGNKWNVYFTNVQTTEGSVEASVVPTTTGTNTTSLEYTVTLDKPGDFYEFRVDAVNNGTIDAMVQNVELSSLDANVSKYISYTVSYLDEMYLKEGDGLAAGETETYRVRVEFKKNIEATDLDEDGVNLTLSFGVDYEQANRKIRENFLNLAKSTMSNGTGLQLLSGTEEDDYPIYYYRGTNSKNNAILGDYCWRVVRTTEKGGTKLLYNGPVDRVYDSYETISRNEYKNVENDVTYPFTYDENENKWINDNPTGEYEAAVLKFSVSESGYYRLNYNIERGNSDWIGLSIRKNGTGIGNISDSGDGSLELYNLNSDDEIRIIMFNEVYGSTEGVGSVSFSFEKGMGDYAQSCNSTNPFLEEGSAIHTKNSPSNIGYMYGGDYEIYQEQLDSGFLYGNSFTYSNGMYTLVNASNSSSPKRYSCFNDTGTCSELNYVFKETYSSSYYITLKDGKSIEDAVSEMENNTKDSQLKATIDKWFSQNFLTYFTNHSKNYNDYLEDAVWCNDRSIDANLSGGADSWISYGGTTGNSRLYYSAYGRKQANTYSLACPNKNDAFTVSDTVNGNGALTYPVATLTLDEATLVGTYLFTSNSWWLMSPGEFRDTYFLHSVVDTSFSNDTSYSSSTSPLSVRPALVVKSNIKVDNTGDGTASNPYKFIVK